MSIGLDWFCIFLSLSIGIYRFHKTNGIRGIAEVILHDPHLAAPRPTHPGPSLRGAGPGPRRPPGPVAAAVATWPGWDPMGTVVVVSRRRLLAIGEYWGYMFWWQFTMFWQWATVSPLSRCHLISPVEFLSVFIWKKLQWLVRTCRNHAFQHGFILTKAGIHWFQHAADDHFEHMRWASDPQRSGWFVGPGPVHWHGEQARDPGKSGEDTVPSVGKWCFSEDFRKMLIQLCDFIFWVVVFDRILRFWANF